MLCTIYTRLSIGHLSCTLPLPCPTITISASTSTSASTSAPEQHAAIMMLHITPAHETMRPTSYQAQASSGQAAHTLALRHSRNSNMGIQWLCAGAELASTPALTLEERVQMHWQYQVTGGNHNTDAVQGRSWTHRESMPADKSRKSGASQSLVRLPASSAGYT
jgi:hypothetical protein